MKPKGLRQTLLLHFVLNHQSLSGALFAHLPDLNK